MPQHIPERRMDPISNTDLAHRLDALEDKVEAIYTILHKFEGMGTLVKFIFVMAAPLWLLCIWLKDHFKW